MTRSALPRLRVETREIDHVEDPLAFTDATHPLVWQRRGDGMVGYGAAVARVTGDAGTAIEDRWRELAAAADIDDPIGVPGTGLVGFGALAFAAASARSSAIVVPQLIVGRRHGRSWLTTVRTDGAISAMPRATEYGPHWSATLGPGAQSPEGYMASVRAGLAAIAAGDVSKVVLARDLAGTVPAGSDLRRLVRALASGYPDTWAFAVDGLIGASPETLVTVEHGVVTARVLAGTAARGADPDADTAASLALATSPKDQDEHQFAVRSVLESLRPHTSALRASEQPFTLKLPNVWHLATDVEGRLADAASALDLVAALHPTAAVAGTPTAAALEAIGRLEPFDRGRYAGPVGWIDANGSGEWAIALRCAQFDPGDPGAPIPLTAYAGAGIVAGSDPESELLETRVKFRPIVDALA
ncbi:isochorismate synthase MenF [Microbacterium sp. cx-59]|uniref:isochorismate synthase n=1 Tax=Microbacterium sp. cx-59 TaxID=2891207 RepID=UPI001E42233A|nr:chorismate-binding protein [Microbacterium sp. cx-59]MCC4909108.1 chorismate-binding protein [Microbacterium sp. cx-59]